VRCLRALNPRTARLGLTNTRAWRATGQTTNLLFGRIYDAHVPHSPRTSFVAAVASGTCTLGRACYAPAFVLTSCMALGALALGLWLALGRKAMRVRAA